MGRPKIAIDDKIDKVIPIKFSATQGFRIKERAKKEHLPVSTLLRKAILEYLNGD